jgi:hypothetical protein
MAPVGSVSAELGLVAWWWPVFAQPGALAGLAAVDLRR